MDNRAHRIGTRADTARPLITFVVPCYNSAAYMNRCIASIVDVAGLVCGAPADDVEILIVDDGSTDDGATLARARGWEARHPELVRTIHQENGGPGEAINTGLAEARGTYFKVVDSDDWLDGPSLAYVLVKLRDICRTSDDSNRASILPGGANHHNHNKRTGSAPCKTAAKSAGTEGGNVDDTGSKGDDARTADSTDTRSATAAPVDAVVCNYVYEHEDGTPERPVRYEHEFPQGRAFGWDDLLHPFPLWNYMMMHSVIWRTALLRAT